MEEFIPGDAAQNRGRLISMEDGGGQPGSVAAESETEAPGPHPDIGG